MEGEPWVSKVVDDTSIDPQFAIRSNGAELDETGYSFLDGEYYNSALHVSPPFLSFLLSPFFFFLFRFSLSFFVIVFRLCFSYSFFFFNKWNYNKRNRRKEKRVYSCVNRFDVKFISHQAWTLETSQYVQGQHLLRQYQMCHYKSILSGWYQHEWNHLWHP